MQVILTAYLLETVNGALRICKAGSPSLQVSWCLRELKLTSLFARIYIQLTTIIEPEEFNPPHPRKRSQINHFFQHSNIGEERMPDPVTPDG
jgi:hypothetical protein